MSQFLSCIDNADVTEYNKGELRELVPFERETIEAKGILYKLPKLEFRYDKEYWESFDRKV